jgi:hypothetical protein
LRYLIPIAIFGLCGYGAGVFHVRKPGYTFIDLLYLLAGPIALAWVYSQADRVAAGLAAGGVALIGFALAHRQRRSIGITWESREAATEQATRPTQAESHKRQYQAQGKPH